VENQNDTFNTLQVDIMQHQCIAKILFGE